MTDTVKSIVKTAALATALYFAGPLVGVSMAVSTAIASATVLIAAYELTSMKSTLDGLNDEVASKQAGIQVNATGTEVTLPVIYGKAKVGISRVDVRQGSIAPSDDTSAVNVLGVCGAIAVAPESGAGIHEVTNVYFNEDEALDGPSFGTNDSSNNPQPFDNSVIKSPWNGNVGSGTFGEDYWLEYFLHDGDDSQTVDYELNRQFSTAWPSTARGLGVAYSVFWFYFNDEIYTNGLPNITMEVKGNKLLDWQDLGGTTARYSENPVDCIFDFMTSQRYGMGIPTANIDCAQTELKTDPITTTSGSTTIQVTHSSTLDIFVVGDTVRLKDATAVGGITAARLNVEMTIVTTDGLYYYTADLGGANASSSGSGGGANVLLDAATFGKEAAYCDESVDIAVTSPSDTVTLSDRFTCNGFLMSDDGPLANLERLLSSCMGRIVMEGGQYKLFVRKAKAVSTFSLDRTNIVGEWDFIRTGVNETPNEIVTTYVDKDFNYQALPQTWPEPGASNAYLTEDNNYRVSSRLELPMTENWYMAEMISAQTLLETRADMGCTLVAQREALKLAVGDVVNVTHPTPDWTDQPMWVEAIGLRRDGLVQLALKEYDSATYTVPSMTTKATMIANSLPPRYTSNTGPTVQVTNLYLESVYQSTSGTEQKYFLRLSIGFSSGMGSFTVTHTPASGGAYTYTTAQTTTSAYVWLLQDGSASQFEFLVDPGVSETGESLISITPYPEASAGGIAGPAVSATFQISAPE